MIEISYFNFLLMMFVYIVAIWFIFYKADYILRIRLENKVLKSELEVRNILIDCYRKWTKQ